MRVRRKRRNRNRHKTWVALSFLGLALLLLNFSLVSRYRPSSRGPAALDNVGTPQGLRIRPAIDHQAGRPVYPYSIIPGGAYSVEELADSLKADPVAAGHYAAFHMETAHMLVTQKPQLYYASYRKGGAVYWTKQPVHVAAGETLISDGKTLARARCGNQLSKEPQQPTVVQSPSEAEMDTPKVTPEEIRGGVAPPGTPPSALAYEIFPEDAIRLFPLITPALGTVASAASPAGIGFGSFYTYPGIGLFPLSGTTAAATPPPFILPVTPAIPVLTPVASPPLGFPTLPPYVGPPTSSGSLTPITPAAPGSPTIPVFGLSAPPSFPFPSIPGAPPASYTGPPPGSDTGPPPPSDTGTPGTPGTPTTDTPGTPGTPGAPDTPGTPDAPVPEPSGILMVLAAAAGAAAWSLRLRQSVKR